jgi:Dolichyl-phosphate-mannose-protein mannosyltransferase
MATDVGVRDSRARTPPLERLALPGWSAPAWGAIGVTALFILMNCWWLTRDRSIPIFDAGLHLSLAINVHEALAQGRLLKALTLTIPYPPFTYLVGSLAIALAGLSIPSLVIVENLVFVSLLALGCYKLGRLAFGPLAGLLAVVFALGSPLLSAQFRVFMTDAPETAMVAVSVWLIIATEGFTRIRACALAGLAVGLGMMTKEPFGIFVVGIVAVTLYRGGRQALRGFAVFAAITLVIMLPWYIGEFHQIQSLGSEATVSSGAFTQYMIPDVAPPRLSIENLTWYLWNLINGQLFLPLFVFATVGWVWTMVGFVRRRIVSPLALELSVGAFVGWLVLTETFIHDTRYSMPLTVYLAVFSAGWIVRLPQRAKVVAATLLALVALANTLGVAFGVGQQVRVVIPGASANTLQQPGIFTIYEDKGFLVSAPRRDGDLLAMLQALRAQGIRSVGWPYENALEADFSNGGVYALAQVAGLENRSETIPAGQLTSRDATLAHGSIGKEEARPCVTLDDHTGVWVRLGNPLAANAKNYCPLPKPHFYG